MCSRLATVGIVGGRARLADSQPFAMKTHTDQLGQSRPEFLNGLDRDPQAVFAGFYALADDLLRICPPGVMRGLDPDRRRDVLHDLVLHCCQDDFRVLRAYRDRGRPFAAWLQMVARNRHLDSLRRKNRANEVPLEDDDGGEPQQVPDPAATVDVDGRLDRDYLLAKVRQALASLSAKCRLLVQGAADGYKPRELVRLMGWPPDWNKKASDDLRECRRRLRRELAALGIDAEGLA